MYVCFLFGNALTALVFNMQSKLHQNFYNIQRLKEAISLRWMTTVSISWFCDTVWQSQLQDVHGKQTLSLMHAVTMDITSLRMDTAALSLIQDRVVVALMDRGSLDSMVVVVPIDRGFLLLVMIGQFHLEHKALQGMWENSPLVEPVVDWKAEGEVGLSLVVRHGMLKALVFHHPLLCSESFFVLKRTRNSIQSQLRLSQQ